MNLFETLKRAEIILPELLENGDWSSLLVDYHPPIVKRLWIPFENCRLQLHEIGSCSPNEALWHSHPWNSIIKVLEGSYRMDIGHSETKDAPKDIDCKLILTKGATYVMDNPFGWHFVSPISPVSYSIMITGEIWKNFSPKPTKKLMHLEQDEILRLKTIFKKLITNN